MSPMDGPSASMYSGSNSTAVTSLSMNNPGGNVTPNDPGVGKSTSVTVDNPAEQGLNMETETMPPELRKTLKNLKHASDKYNAIETKNHYRMVTTFTDLNRDYTQYLSKEEQKNLLDILHKPVDKTGQLESVHEY